MRNWCGACKYIKHLMFTEINNINKTPTQREKTKNTSRFTGKVNQFEFGVSVNKTVTTQIMQKSSVHKIGFCLETLSPLCASTVQHIVQYTPRVTILKSIYRLFCISVYCL